MSEKSVRPDASDVAQGIDLNDLQELVEGLIDSLPEEALTDEPGNSRKEKRDRLHRFLTTALECGVADWRAGYARLRAVGKPELGEAFFNDLEEALSESAHGNLQPDQDAALVTDRQFDQLFRLSMQILLRGEAVAARPMFLVLLSFRPLDSRPYIGILSALWETEGVEVAADGYQALCAAWPDPRLARFAALCLKRAGRIPAAQEILQHAIRSAESLSESESPGAHRVAERLRQQLVELN